MSKYLSRRRFVSVLAVATGATVLSACGDTATPTSIAAPTATASSTDAAADHAAWSYDGSAGATHWGDLDGYALCKAGKEQSPIDIATTAPLNPPQSITLSYKDSAISLVNNGHTAQVNYDKGSTLTVGGKTYDLLQFHFHSPSEHTINGKATEMELHLVHQNAADKSLAVLGLMLKQGAENEVLTKFWDSIPASKGNVTVNGTVNINTILPPDKSYYTYAGSLTTPPCSEGVKWMVLKQPMEVSAAQVQKYSKIFGNSARPVQPVNTRIVSVS